MESTANDGAINQIADILRRAGTNDPPIPPTLLYNEGWLLRLILSAAEKKIPCLPFAFAPGARWFSEARLYSQFLAKHRGDVRAEKHTHADGVVGHFSFNRNSKTGLRLSETGSQFILIEAKIFGKLSTRTKNAPNFDQVVRTIACMANTLAICGKDLNQWQSLGFYLLAPRDQLERGRFSSALTKESILLGIRERIASYSPQDLAAMHDWEDCWVKPLVERLRIECVTWESVVGAVQECDKELGEQLRQFYELTLKFNGSIAPAKCIPGQAFTVVGLSKRG